MSNIEKIKAEIERLKEEYNEQVSARLISESLVSMGKVEALNKVLAFIDSLPDNDFLDESIIASKDIEEEMERMWLNWCEDVDYLSYLSIARYFAEWGAKHLK